MRAKLATQKKLSAKRKQADKLTKQAKKARAASKRAQEASKKVDDALKVLKNPDNVIMLSQEGKCKLKKSKSIILEEKNHSEFRSEYSFSCKKVSNVKSIKINVFDKFKNS